jgi:S-DNA-T family DNA segregation ATPase FtsK/SpoIIIE
VIPIIDVERVTALFDHLDHRRDPSDADRLLVVDGADDLALPLAEQLLGLGSRARTIGLRMLITGGRSLLGGRWAATADLRIALRLPDPSDYLMVGRSGRDLPTELPPGRGVRSPDGALLQLATPDATSLSTAHSWPPPRVGPRMFPVLPATVALAGLARPPHTILGLGSDGEPVTLPDEVAVVLIVGPPRSGRSTALATIARQTRQPTVTICRDGSPLARLADPLRLPREDQDHAVAVLRSLGRPVDVFVDDLEALPDGPLTDHLSELVREPSGRVVLSATADAAATSFREPLPLARNAATILLLGAVDRRAGQSFGLSLPAAMTPEPPPGRGWIAVGGRTTAIQVAEVTEPQPRTEFELAALGERNRE